MRREIKLCEVPLHFAIAVSLLGSEMKKNREWKSETWQITTKGERKERKTLKTLNKIASESRCGIYRVDFVLCFFGKGAFVESEGMGESQQARYAVFHVSFDHFFTFLWYTKVKFTKKRRNIKLYQSSSVTLPIIIAPNIAVGLKRTYLHQWSLLNSRYFNRHPTHEWNSFLRSLRNRRLCDGVKW